MVNLLEVDSAISEHIDYAASTSLDPLKVCQVLSTTKARGSLTSCTVLTGVLWTTPQHLKPTRALAWHNGDASISEHILVTLSLAWLILASHANRSLDDCTNCPREERAVPSNPSTVHVRWKHVKSSSDRSDGCSYKFTTDHACTTPQSGTTPLLK